LHCLERLDVADQPTTKTAFSKYFVKLETINPLFWVAVGEMTISVQQLKIKTDNFMKIMRQRQEILKHCENVFVSLCGLMNK